MKKLATFVMKPAKQLIKKFEQTNRERWLEEDEKNIAYFYPYAKPLGETLKSLLEILDSKYKGDEPYYWARTDIIKIINEMETYG